STGSSVLTTIRSTRSTERPPSARNGSARAVTQGMALRVASLAWIPCILILASVQAFADLQMPLYEDVQVLSGLDEPTVVRFAPNGDIWIAEKAGRVKVFSASHPDPAGTVVLDISDQVMDFGDRGLLGMALDPGFPAAPY